MFLIIPVGVDYRAYRYPMVTFSIIGLNTVIFLASLFQGPVETMEDLQASWYYGLWYTPADSPWYCWITSLFVHGGFLHLIGNMAYLFLFGSPVEDMLGRWKFALFYLLGGFASNLMHVAFTAGHFESILPLGGASGAISACMGAFALLMFRSEIEFKWIAFIFLRFGSGEFSLPTWLVMSFWFLCDLAGAFLDFGSKDGGTAFGAHVGGFLSGMAMISMVKLLWHRGIMRQANLDDDDDEAAAAEAPAIKPIPLTRPTAPIRIQIKEKPVTYVSENGAQTGPFTVAEIRHKLAAGEITQEAWYWREGMAEWKGVWEIT